MELTDIMSVEEWASLEEELYKICGMNVRVYDKEGKHITSHEGWANSLCPLIRATHEGLMTVCSIAQQHAAIRARKDQAPVLSECDAGLIKFVVPVFSGEEFLGTLGACGYRLPDVEVEISLLNDVTGVDTEKLEQAAADVGILTEDKAKELMDCFQEHLNAALSRHE